MTAGDALFAVADGQGHGNAVAVLVDTGNADALTQVDAFVDQPLAHHGDGIGIILGQDVVAFEDRDAGAEPAMRLGHLAADRSTADDDQMFRTTGLIKDRLVGEVGNVFQAGDRRCDGARAGRNDEPFGADQLVANGDFARTGEAAGALDDLDAKTLEPLDGVIRFDGLDDAMDVIVHRGKVDLGLMTVDAEPAALAHSLGRLCRGQQGL